MAIVRTPSHLGSKTQSGSSNGSSMSLASIGWTLRGTASVPGFSTPRRRSPRGIFGAGAAAAAPAHHAPRPVVPLGDAPLEVYLPQGVVLAPQGEPLVVGVHGDAFGH